MVTRAQIVRLGQRIEAVAGRLRCAVHPPVYGWREMDETWEAAEKRLRTFHPEPTPLFIVSFRDPDSAEAGHGQ